MTALTPPSHFRVLTLDDLAACLQIYNDLETHYEHPIGGEWSQGKIAQELELGQSFGTYDAQGELLAFCLCRRAADILEILLLATRPREHRTGAMRTLIRSVIHDLAPDEKIWLEVHAGNLPAISLYESLGFQLTGERPHYYGDGGKALLFEYKPLQ